MSHTPGPWVATRGQFVIPAEHSDRPIGGAADATVNRTVYAQVILTAHHDRHGRGDQSANARLAAAAPDLLEAAQAMLFALCEDRGIPQTDDDYISDELGSVVGGAYFRLRQAIRKAKGESA